MMIRIVATVSLAILAECTPALCADLADGPYLGGKDKLLKKSPVDLGLRNVPNWLKFPPTEHPMVLLSL